MGEDSASICTADPVVASTVKAFSEDGSENSPQSGDDSGHDSNPSTPESPPTPTEQRVDSPGCCVIIVSSVAAEKAEDEGDTSLNSNDSTFYVQIQAPGSEPFDLQVNSSEMIQELHQVLLERESTCHRTCFSLQLNGTSLDHFTELKNIKGLRDGSVLKVVEEPYTIREARIHVRHVRELIRSLDMTDAVNGAEGASLTYLATMTLGDRKKSLDKLLECAPPEYLLPGHKERPLVPLFPTNTETVVALKSLAISPYNPPPGPRKMKGDILYLIVETREERRYHITCCTRGFYVNATTDQQSTFKPTPSPSHKAVYHSLVDLLSSISPAFRKAYALILKKRSEKHIFERLPTPYQVNSWVAPSLEQNEDGIRAEDCTQPHRIGLEDHIPGQVRDWNEELQTTHELPKESINERLVRERAIFKIHSDFVSAAIKVLFSFLLFTFHVDMELGGDAAAHAATSNDLQGVRAYVQLDTPKLFTLGMVIVDYKGYRVTAQSIIPGILEREQEQSVVYGSVDFGKTVISSETCQSTFNISKMKNHFENFFVLKEYRELLEKPAEQLKIQPHEVLSGKEDGQTVKLYSSFETKGIVGNDSRHYILDLLRTFPPDVNYLEGAEVTEICKKNGYPRPFPHKLASLRQELIEAFVDYRYLMFVRIAAHHVQQMHLDGTKALSSSAENSDKAKTDEQKKVDEGDEQGKGEDDKRTEQQETTDSEKKSVDRDEAIVSQIKSEIVADAKQEEIPQLETEAAKKLLSGTIEGVADEKKDEDSFDQEISKKVHLIQDLIRASSVHLS
ncbi:unnamed protein product [Anisakis simplex]|uniref:Clustered mitochondria protein homolog (inferred by orthology to a C. elegans protein) n=1 Tax=Anisakis simplex TaxID=6269 RepID=A0A0M3K224_ANISI|nr:unnamed protein product [Anisakis simplex]